FSYRVGNYLAGNPDGAGSIEATYLGPHLQFAEDTVIAITGAEIPAKINGRPVATSEALQVQAGDVLSFDFPRSGARSHIAVAGRSSSCPESSRSVPAATLPTSSMSATPPAPSRSRAAWSRSSCSTTL